MTRAAAMVLVSLLAGGTAQAERLTIALSTREVKIDSNFTGTSITIFGVIARDAETVSRPGTYQVATLVLGPPETVVARRKDRILGIWANGASETIVGVPSFYSVETSGPLDLVASDAILRRHGIGLANISLQLAGAADPGAEEFRDAYIRLKQTGQLYAERVGGVAFIDGNVFRSNVVIPANVPLGQYTVRVDLFSGSALLATAEDSMEISKSGFEQYISTVARSQSLTYGLACVALALFTGWLAGVIFRRD
jgi:uncharacterized protein (TIGR02186 family)